MDGIKKFAEYTDVSFASLVASAKSLRLSHRSRALDRATTVHILLCVLFVGYM